MMLLVVESMSQIQTDTVYLVSDNTPTTRVDYGHISIEILVLVSTNLEFFYMGIGSITIIFFLLNLFLNFYTSKISDMATPTTCYYLIKIFKNIEN